MALYRIRGWAESISVVAVSGAAINTVSSLIDSASGPSCCSTLASSDKVLATKNEPSVSGVQRRVR